MDENQYYLEYLKRTGRFPQSIYHRAKHKMVHEMFESLPKGSIALDAGCGIGHITAGYRNDYRIVGIDEQLSALQCCPKIGGGKYIQASLYSLPFKDGTFELVLFLDAIEHLRKPVSALKELARVMKNGAKILICTMNYENPLWFVLEHTWHRFFGGGCKPYSKDVHPTQYNEALLREHCKDIFKEISLKKRVMDMELFYIGERS